MSFPNLTLQYTNVKFLYTVFTQSSCNYKKRLFNSGTIIINTIFLNVKKKQEESVFNIEAMNGKKLRSQA